MGQTFGKAFGTSEIGGSGYNQRQLSHQGYTPDEITSMGGPGAGAQAGQKALFGGLQGGLKSLQQAQPQQSGGAPPIVPAQQPQVDMSGAMPQYFQNPMQRRSPSQQFFGGY